MGDGAHHGPRSSGPLPQRARVRAPASDRRPGSAVAGAAGACAQVALSAGVLLGLAGCATATPPHGEVATVGTASYATELVVRTNAVRAAEMLPALAVSTCAATAAERRAQALVGSGLEHAPLDGVAQGCDVGSVSGENLSRASATPTDVVGAWLGSPGHRANLLDPTYTQVGVACVEDDGAMLCSQVFLGL